MKKYNLKSIEFKGFKREAGLMTIKLSAKKWIETTAAIGIVSKSGRYINYFGCVLKKLNIPSRRINGNTYYDVVECLIWWEIALICSR
jgi:hypothetical protein